MTIRNKESRIVRMLKYAVWVVLPCLCCHCAIMPTSRSWDVQHQDKAAAPAPLCRIVDQVAGRDALPAGNLAVTYPYANAMFPPDIAAPTILWEDGSPASRQWLITLTFQGDRKPVYALTREPRWTPEIALWERIKTDAAGQSITISVQGLADGGDATVTGADTVPIEISTDPVDAAIFYRQVPLPFLATPEGFQRTRWRLGDISDNGPPKVVLTGVPVCASCHQFSRDGRRMSMEMNRNNDGGAQLVAAIEKEIKLNKDNFMSWSDFPRSGILPPTRGLFGKMSPSGRYLAASVNEISYAAVLDAIDFSQLFFPTYGILAYYSVADDTIRALPGADDTAYVHANPNWSPDDRYIVFARAPIKNEVHADITHVTPHRPAGTIHELNKEYWIHFDLYRVPFNKGKGGTAVPIKGASNNGMSNYFARYSPDGKWIVFTRSKSGIMLQPDSELYIIPAEGGTPRRMNCNRALFNSWHSWSPNGKWLLFTSKVNTPYTEIFLTHIDENGIDTPPVLLSRFSDDSFAANVPEFTPFGADAIDSIQLAP